MNRYKSFIFLATLAMSLSACGSSQPPEVTKKSVYNLSIEALSEGREYYEKRIGEIKDEAKELDRSERKEFFLNTIRPTLQQAGLYDSELTRRAYKIGNAVVDAAGWSHILICKKSPWPQPECNRFGDKASGRTSEFGLATLKEGYDIDDAKSRDDSLLEFANNYRNENYDRR